MSPSPHEFMGWVVLTLVFTLAGNFAAIGAAILLKIDKEAKALTRSVLALITIGNIVALLFALLGLAIAH